LPHINQARLLTTLYGENKISADVMRALVLERRAQAQEHSQTSIGRGMSNS